MSKAKTAKKQGVELGPDSDPKVLYTTYVKECKSIAIEPSNQLKAALTNEENANLGKQIIVVGTEEEKLGPKSNVLIYSLTVRPLALAASTLYLLRLVSNYLLIYHPFSSIAKILRSSSSPLLDPPPSRHQWLSLLLYRSQFVDPHIPA